MNLKRQIFIFITFFTLGNAFAAPLPLYQTATPAPAFSWLNEQGNTKTLEDYKGKVIFLNFWATWCAPCVVEMPAFDFLHERYNLGGFEIIAINVGAESSTTIQRFMEQNNIKHLPIHIDPTQQLTNLFGTATLPTTYVINREGKIIAGKVGLANWMSPEMMNFIELRKPNPYNNTPAFNRAPVENITDLLQPAVRF